MPNSFTPYCLQFFEATAADEIVELHDHENSVWSGVIHCVKEAINDEKLLRKKVALSVSSDQKRIQVLFVKIANLQSKQFFYNLCHTILLRKVRPPAGSKDSESAVKYKPCPLITIGVHDIMSIYEEAPGLDFEPEERTEYWKDRREKDKLLYKLDLDHRVKFLDSSIWHRYVPLNDSVSPGREEAEAGKGFEERITGILKKILGYYEQGLYESVAAVTTLEFNSRMLIHSFIDKAGDRGHHEAVTPFKFHSETVMEEKNKRFLQFLEKERENDAKLSLLEWNVLMVDDHSDTPLSSIHGTASEASGQFSNKKDLIKDLLTAGTPLKIKIGGHTTGDNKIISNGIEALKQHSYDIILLDYLLGQSEANPSLKAYGHEFLLEMATGPHKRLLRRGPMGRFWIYPISSFPHAFTDKLRQLNIDGSNRRWYIANGGDPISTPELFRVNFYRLLLRQIGEYYLHDAALERWAGQFMGIKDKMLWQRAIEHQIETEKQKPLFLASNRGSSVFSKTMSRFLSRQQEYARFWDALKSWLKQSEQYEPGRSGQYLLSLLHATYKPDSPFASVFKLLEEQALAFVTNSEAELMETALGEKHKRTGKIIFSEKPLFHFPEEVAGEVPHLEELRLTNLKLSFLPDAVSDLNSLEILDLQGNQDLVYIPAGVLLNKCSNLEQVNLENTAIGKYLKDEKKSASAITRGEVESLLKHIAQSEWNKPPDRINDSHHNAPTLSVFISYPHKSADHKSRLVTHLASLKRENRIRIWDDGAIVPGQEWNKQIKQNLAGATIILFLVDADFIASDYIDRVEIRLSLERQRNGECIVIPVFTNHADIGNSPLRNLQGLPKGPNEPVAAFDNQEYGWALVAAGIRRAVEEIAQRR